MNSGTSRAAALGGLLGAAGWLIFAAGFVTGIAVVAVRAAHGTASVGQVVLAVTLIQRAQLQVGQAAAAFGQLLTTARTARRMLWLEDYAAADRAASLAAGQAPPPEVLSSGLTLRMSASSVTAEATTVAATNVGARSSFAAASGPAASFNLASATGPITRNRHGFVRWWFGAQRPSSSSSSSTSRGTGSGANALWVRLLRIASSTSIASHGSDGH